MGVLTVVVERHEKALVVRDGKVTGVLEPGRHRRERRTTYERIDVRERITTVAAQEVLTADTVTVKVSVALRWQILDPVAYTAVTDAEAVVYLAVQIALRDELSGREAMDVVRAGRTEVTPVLLEAARLAAASVGISVDDVVVKDIVLPGEMKTILAQVVEAGKSAEANVIRRREETAATRSLLNTAKVMEDNPVALRLKELETLERVAERIDKISVFGGLDQVLNGLVKLR
jgi:regulator of protease activity HflC (stomatin/prohibitin superfamily)